MRDHEKLQLLVNVKTRRTANRLTGTVDYTKRSVGRRLLHTNIMAPPQDWTRSAPTSTCFVGWAKLWGVKTGSDVEEGKEVLEDFTMKDVAVEGQHSVGF